MKKYIFVTGGVCSSLGKGLAAASVGALLEAHEIPITLIKIDPYINVDAGTMSPFQHGEVYVTEDGAETDLDLGNYYRYTNACPSRKNTITTGQIYQEVIRRERAGDYLGHCVQMIPHISDEIKRRITLAAREAGRKGVAIIEVGGTVGDIESVPFLEAARQFVHEKGRKNVLFIHLTLVPRITGDEMKTKPTQHSVKELREIGIQPDILLCRASKNLTKKMRKKISLFTNVDKDSIISARDITNTVYEIPLLYYKQNLQKIIFEKLKLKTGIVNMEKWQSINAAFIGSKKRVKIAMIGKYTTLSDSYKSINEALLHGGLFNGAQPEIAPIESDNLEDENQTRRFLGDADGIIMPGGFGRRGVEGMVRATAFARRQKRPFFGICLGMQVMIIEFARHVLGLSDANSTEFDPKTPNPVVSMLEEQQNLSHLGGTMRLGNNQTKLKADTRIFACYQNLEITERHRHRYEVALAYRQALEEGGLIICGENSDNQLIESIEWPDHPWNVGVQFHPEFTSKPEKPNPLFIGFIKAALTVAAK